MSSGTGKFKAERQARYRRGHLSEYAAAALLLAKGYRILARRFRSPAGEIDLVVCRGKRLVFVEVKRRPTMQECESSITALQSRRVRRAADYWLARHPHHREHEIAFDAVFLTPRRLPKHVPDGL